MQTKPPEPQYLLSPNPESSGLKHVWVNGQAVEHLSVLDRGVAYGHGVFETVCVLKKQPQLWTLHIKRLDLGCQRLFIPIDLSVIDSQVSAFLQTAYDGGTLKIDGVLKIIVTAGAGGRGYGLPEKPAPQLVLLWFARPPMHKDRVNNGISVQVCKTRLATQPLLAGIKHLNRLEQVLAKQEMGAWRPSVSEGLMLDQDGNVIEGVMSNLFIVKDGVLATAGLDGCGVAGVVREMILSKDFQYGASITRNISIDDVLNADEVFVCNSLIGVWPVVKLVVDDGEVCWVRGEITRCVQKEILKYCFNYD